jgi:DNA-binding Xre family transcriptional regulator
MTEPRRFTWLLEQRMHERGIHQITALQRELVARGIDLSSSQVHRLVTQTPERLNLEVLAALCDILSCSPAELIEVQARTARRKVGGENVVDMATTGRPRRARVLRPQDDK